MQKKKELPKQLFLLLIITYCLCILDAAEGVERILL